MGGTTLKLSRYPARVIVAVVAMLLVAGALAGPARAETVTVTHTGDFGAGSLRQAITDAAPGDTIDFSVTGTIVLTGLELRIHNSDLTIAGPGAEALTVSGNNQSRVFNVDSGSVVEISGLTITGGRVVGSDGPWGANGSQGSSGQAGTNGGDAGGGGILNNGALTLRDVAVSGNAARGGAGGFGGRGGDGPDNTCSSSDNGGSGGFGGSGGSAAGGGILNNGTLTLQGSTVSGNTAEGGAGGFGGSGGNGGDESIFCRGGNGGAGGRGGPGGSGKGGGVFDAGTLTVTNSTIDGNAVRGGHGGSGGTGGSGGDGSTDGTGGSGGAGANGAAAEGGGTHDPNGNATLVNATVSDNSANGGAGGAGGSAFAGGSQGTSGSAGTGRGGGVFSGGGTALGNTIVAPNTASTSAPNISGTFGSGGHNLVGDPGGAIGFVGSDIQNGDPGLGPLQDNGGQTKTRALPAGSGAVDAADTAAAPPKDQRGVTRPQGAAADIGAYEHRPPRLSVSDTVVAEGDAGTTNATFTVTRAAGDGEPGTSTVTYATSDGTATAGSDYTRVSGQIAFASSESSRTITVGIRGDVLDEADETFFVNLRSPTDAVIGDGRGKGVIDEDDDRAPAVKRVIPAENATGVAPGANVLAFFSEAMRVRSVNVNTVKLYPTGSTEALPATVSYDAETRKTTLDPGAPLVRGQRYKAVVSPGAKDLAGNALDQNRGVAGNQPKVWFFTVRS